MRSTRRGRRDIHSMSESLKHYIVAILSDEICHKSSINLLSRTVEIKIENQIKYAVQTLYCVKD